ncbi:MAG: transketolase family protein [Bacillota bacterium]
MTKSQRVAYGQALVDLGAKNQNIVVLEADLGKSTMGHMFEIAYPDRFYEMGIAEADMASVAAGFSLTGKVPFISSFAVFCPGRCYDQIRTSICIPSLNVKICGSSAGLSDYGDGSTHQSIDDISLMKVLPNMQVFSPVDAVQVTKVVEYMAANKGPMYMRVNRNDLPILTSESEKFVPGKVYTMREGKDVAVFATGIMVSKALEAAESLSKEGIDVKVLNVPSIKPLDAINVQEIAASVKAIVTAEEHSIYGGLGDAISAAVSFKLACKLVRIGINDTFGTSGQNYTVLLEKYNLTAESIISAIHTALE